MVFSRERKLGYTGSGTTLIEAKLLGRNAIGIDINSEAVKLSNTNLDFTCQESSKIFTKQGNANNLSFIKHEHIDLICTHPPYADIIQYSKSIPGDIRKAGYVLPLGMNTMQTFVDSGFKLKEIIVKEQHNCLSTDY